MAAKEVVKYGDPILRKKTADVEDFTQLTDLVEQMFDTMVEEEGIGLAANQIGVDLNLLVFEVIDLDEDIDSGKVVMANAEIIASSGKEMMEEGCLSLPDVRIELERPEQITVRYQDISGTIQETSFTGMQSRVIQHEFDHLHGRFITDYLTPAKKSLIQKRLQEIAKNGKPSRSVVL